MKYFPLAIILLLLCLPAFAADLPAGPDLMINGGFEKGPWVGENKPRDGAVDLLNVHSGDRAAKLTAQPDREVWCYGPGVNIDPAKRYLLTVWVKCDTVSDPTGVSVYFLEWGEKNPVGWVWNYKAGQGIKFFAQTGGTHGWTRYCAILEKFTSQTIKIGPYIYINKGTGAAYVDDFQLQEWQGEELPPDLERLFSEDNKTPEIEHSEPVKTALPQWASGKPEDLKRENFASTIFTNGSFDEPLATDLSPLPIWQSDVAQSGGALELKAGTGPVCEVRSVNANLDYRFSVWIKTQDVPEKSLKLRLWPGWFNEKTMDENLVITGGTQDWKKYEIVLRDINSDMAGKTWWLHYEFDKAKENAPVPQAWIDEAKLEPLTDSLRVKSEQLGNYFIENSDKKLDILISGIPAGETRRLRWAMADFWGNFAGEGETSIKPDDKNEAVVEVELTDRGYYGMYFMLDDGNGNISNSTFASAGILSPPPADAKIQKPESIFGCWGCPPELAPLLGIKWTRWTERSQYFTPSKDIPGAYDWNLAQWYGPYDPHAARQAEIDAGMNCYLVFHTWADWLLLQEAGTKSPVPTDWKKHTDFVKFVYQKVADVVDPVEVWNEPVISWGWQGTAQDIVDMHREVYKTVKEINPQATVIGPCDDIKHLQTFGELGGFNWIDALAIHPYRQESPEATDFVGDLREAKEIMGRFGGEKPIWITEMGWTTAPDKYTELEQANWVVRAYLLAMGEGVRHLNIHIFNDWNNSNVNEKYFGITRIDRTPKPAAIAYATMTRQLEGAKFAEALTGLPPATFGYVFKQGDKFILVLWNAAVDGVPVKLSTSANQVTVTQLDGKARELPVIDGVFGLEIGQSPVFIQANMPLEVVK